jgi:hypothetical protein
MAIAYAIGRKVDDEIIRAAETCCFHVKGRWHISTHFLTPS